MMAVIIFCQSYYLLRFFPWKQASSKIQKGFLVSKSNKQAFNLIALLQIMHKKSTRLIKTLSFFIKMSLILDKKNKKKISKEIIHI